jgi:hypothetical protein
MNLTYNCFFKLFPDERAGAIILTNHCDDNLLWQLVTSLYDHVLGLPSPKDLPFSKPAAFVPPPTAHPLQHYAGAFLRIETADLITFAVVDNELVLEYHGKSLSLTRIGDDHFYAQVSERYGFPIAFIHNAGGEIIHLMLGGEPYHPIELDPTFVPDLELWKSYEGIYKDPSNSKREEMFRIRVHDGVLFFAEDTHELPCKAISNRTFLSDLGMIDFGDTHSAHPVLRWGKAVRYYPVDQRTIDANRIIEYLVDVPAVPQRVG